MSLTHGNIFHDSGLVFHEHTQGNDDVEQDRHSKMLSDMIVIVNKYYYVINYYFAATTIMQCKKPKSEQIQVTVQYS